MVLDTSACLDILLDTPRGLGLADVLQGADHPVLAPGLLWAEVGRVLRAKTARGVLSPRDAETALANLIDLGIAEAEAEPLLMRVWELRDNIAFDDGMFVALAEASGQPLMTTDLRLASAARQHVGIEVVTDLDV
jgi:predicted nucleic acid-binding protein